MRDYITLGGTPCDEECAMVGSKDYASRAMKECMAFKNQLLRRWPNARLRIMAFPHDFGSYHEVVATYSNEEEQRLAYKIEANTPAKWDADAKKELQIVDATQKKYPPMTIGAVLQNQERDKVEQAHAASLDIEELREMALGFQDCIAADGCSVEPDGSCQHGYRSPLLVKGLI